MEVSVAVKTTPFSHLLLSSCWVGHDTVQCVPPLALRARDGFPKQSQAVGSGREPDMVSIDTSHCNIHSDILCCILLAPTPEACVVLGDRHPSFLPYMPQI